MRGGTRKRGDTWTWYFDAADPATGKRRQRSKGGFRTKREAQAALSEALAAYRAGTLVEPSKLTLGAFLDEWLPAMAGNLEPNTHEVYGHYARAYVKPELGHVRLQQLTATDLRGFYAELAASGGRRSQGLKPKTVKNMHALIHRALEDAVDQGLMTRNVAALRSARPPKLDKTERGVWTPESLRTFLTAMAADRLAALWLLLATTGLRRSEALGLPWRAIDLEGGQLTVMQRLVTVAGKPTHPAGHQVPGRGALDRPRPGDGGGAQGPPRPAAPGAARRRRGVAGSRPGIHPGGRDATSADAAHPDVRPAGPRGRPARLDVARAPAHLRHGEPSGRRPRQGRKPTPRPRQYGHHVGPVSARPEGDGCRGRQHRRPPDPYGDQQDSESSAVNPLSTGRPVPDAERG
jgi:integrase